MKILILTCSTGEGHNSAARSLKKYLDSQKISCDVYDPIGMFSPRAARKISDIYVHSLSNYMFKILYYLGGQVSMMLSKMGDDVKSPVYWVCKRRGKRLFRFMQASGYDAVICTHPFPAETMTYLKRKGLLKIPSLYIATDYTCIPFVHELETDAVVMPHADLTEEYVKKGVKPERIRPIGIPVDDSKFMKHTEKEEARNKIRKMYGIVPRDPGGKWFLLMSGSMGFGNLEHQIQSLLELVNDNDRVICVCGNNEKVRKSLTQKFADCKALTVLGFTNDIPLLMDASDVLFTKPGGLTSTEAAIKGIPMIHTEATAGLEDANKAFFNSHGMSLSAESLETQAYAAMRLCYDQTCRDKMLMAQEETINHQACHDIIVLVKELIAEKATA